MFASALESAEPEPRNRASDHKSRQLKEFFVVNLETLALPDSLAMKFPVATFEFLHVSPTSASFRVVCGPCRLFQVQASQGN